MKNRQKQLDSSEAMASRATRAVFSRRAGAGAAAVAIVPLRRIAHARDGGDGALADRRRRVHTRRLINDLALLTCNCNATSTKMNELAVLQVAVAHAIHGDTGAAAVDVDRVPHAELDQRLRIHTAERAR